MEGGTSTLTQTTVIADNRAYRGGAFYVKGGTLTLTGAIIDNNTATNLGSGIYADSVAARITITGSTFSNNKCLGTAANNGGAIFCNNANVVITITGSTFSGNTSVNADGVSAIYNNAGTVSISDTVFGSRTDTIYNKATMSFDGTVALAGNVRIGVVGSVPKTISVRENTTLAFLLADRSESDEVILNYSHLAFSDAASVTWSVGIGADQAAGDYKLLGGGSAVTTASVYDVSVPTTAVAMTVNATPKQLGDKYVWLHTDSSGNLCLRVSDELYAVTSLTGTVKNLYTDAVLPPLTVNGTTVDELEVFTGATMSNASGKALNNTGGAVTITGAIITGSGAGQNTGGAVVNNRTLTASDTIFGNNTAARQGAAIYNYASSGSAVLTLNNVKFFHNALTEDSNYTYGAALINLAGGTTTVTGGTFSENSSAHYGGAVAVTAGTVAFSGTTFASNSATRGGVFFANGGVLTISDAVLSDNTAEAYGGGVYTESGANVTIAGSTFSGNRASTNGGAIYNNGGSISISDSVFAATTDTIYNNGTMSWSGSITLAGEVGVNTGKSITVADNTALTLLLADRTAADNAILNYGNFSFGDASSITWNAAVASDQAAGDYKLAGAGSAVTTVSVYDVAAPATAITLTTNSEPQQLDGRYVWLHTDSDNNLCLQVADAVYGKSYLGATVKNLYADASMAPVTLDGTTLDKLEVFSGATFSGTSKAVNSTGSTVTVTGALFADIDTAEYGGVAITNINGSLEVSNTTIARTVGASRGAIMNRTGSATPATAVMTDVVFLDNKATAAGSLGGAVFNYATAAGYTASYTQTGGYFSGNTAGSGGAIYNDGVMLLTGVTFSGNFASDNGGAIYNARTLTLTNTTFAAASDTIHNSGTLTFSGTNALNASVTGSGTITVDSGAALVFANSEAISVAALTLIGSNAVTFNGSAAVNFASQDLSDVAITVDGSAYAGSEIVVATGVSAIGSYTVTGADDLTLYTAGG
ncbi:MAG: hypothetical protein MR051_03995, partial [Lentisphaeria bacterium]|nr:hypothetical protein [Lentisphaeria bacterium]